MKKKKRSKTYNKYISKINGDLDFLIEDDKSIFFDDINEKSHK